MQLKLSVANAKKISYFLGHILHSYFFGWFLPKCRSKWWQRLSFLNNFLLHMSHSNGTSLKWNTMCCFNSAWSSNKKKIKIIPYSSQSPMALCRSTCFWISFDNCCIAKWHYRDELTCVRQDPRWNWIPWNILHTYAHSSLPHALARIGRGHRFPQKFDLV